MHMILIFLILVLFSSLQIGDNQQAICPFLISRTQGRANKCILLIWQIFDLQDPQINLFRTKCDAP